MTAKSTFYITTPIYYPNDKLHIGHAYTTVAADALARYKRQRGYDVMFLTGTDEHGQKIQKRAEEAGQPPLQYLDEIIAWIQDLWEKLDISYNDFIRTTESRHTEQVAAIFERLIEQDDIYLADYEGWYCTPCESFWSERELADGKCPDCGREVQWLTEQSYFFRMSKYVDRLLEFYEQNPQFIQPESRKNEMINNFIKPGLQDLCVSRTSFDWGIQVTRNPKHVVYVWLDALTNYITAIGYGSENQELQQQFQRYWPADVHFVGKEIVRFHTIYWPIILMALGLPLPKQVYGHGFLLMKDGKMSKSKGNVIDPKVLVQRYGSDAVRYFLLREIPFGQDGVFTPDAFMERLNYDLANDFGNLVHRTAAMVHKFAGGVLPKAGVLTKFEEELMELEQQTISNTEKSMDALQFSQALTSVWQLVRRVNKYIDETQPWALNKAGDTERLGTVLHVMVEMIRVSSILTTPFIPQTAEKIAKQFHFADTELTWDTLHEFGILGAGRDIDKANPLFPRLDVAEEIQLLAQNAGNGKEGTKMDETKMDGTGMEGAQIDRTKIDGAQIDGAKQQNKDGSDIKNEKQESDVPGKAQIGIDAFDAVELKVGQVKVCDKVKGADKLLRLEVDLGTEVRQIVSGIAKHYTPEELVGEKVIVVTNLKPVKLRGVESNGMILAASQGDSLKLATVPDTMPNGAVVK
ncbi:methionine--tRNA ligase [Alicyclobacillus sp. SO9]|uniref:methionine--tRNA ligase n=1 Tax=Alicyclobacillus sp. SO9 TaxID=2665646 RepID=UPI0018E6EFA3|nr:methionine--tRNA ligase [Alicyclobacillus sp. SO9]QQE79389.1 methionine--tRNA ligase [Alicyclobacillus sp. SO9]